MVVHSVSELAKSSGFHEGHLLFDFLLAMHRGSSIGKPMNLYCRCVLLSSPATSCCRPILSLYAVTLCCTSVLLSAYTVTPYCLNTATLYSDSDAAAFLLSNISLLPCISLLVTGLALQYKVHQKLFTHSQGSCGTLKAFWSRCR